MTANCYAEVKGTLFVTGFGTKTLLPTLVPGTTRRNTGNNWLLMLLRFAAQLCSDASARPIFSL